MIYMEIRFKQWPFHIVQINTNNINNYLTRDNEAHQYNWVCPPNCTEPGFSGVITWVNNKGII